MGDGEHVYVVYIDGERLLVRMDGGVEDQNQPDGCVEMETTCGRVYLVFEDRDVAGEAARNYWEELAKCDAEEFTALVGKETLVKWALGQWAGPGSTKVQSLSDWLDLWLFSPEEHWGTYDMEEHLCECKHPDFLGRYTAAYRQQ